jgi:hypothetical protein
MEKELIKIIKTLNKHKIKYLLIGGFAAVLYGVPRSTFDIDIAISPDSKNIGDTITLLSGLGFSQIPEEESHIKQEHGIALTNGKVEVDLMFIEQPRFDIIYEYHTKLSYKGTIIKLPNIMDLVSIKESSLREKDRLDAQILRNIASLRRKG